MGFLDKARSAARKAMHEHPDKVKDATDKAGDLLDKKTGGKHTDQIEQGKEKLGDALDNLDRKKDDTH
jgi:hypothetical protein